jgi:arabinan endo-1,5-alpha-L-arabinosidase
MFSSPLIVAVSALVTTVAAYANPGSCSGECWTHDPSVVRRSDGTYFRFSTGSKIGIYSASALSGPWTYKGSAIPAGSSINLDGKDDLWAPDVLLVGDTYHLYYSVSSFGSQNSAIGYATSSTLDVGSWTDHGATGVSSSAGKSYNAIDSNVFAAADGSYHMNFGSFWGDIYSTTLNSAATKNSGSSAQISYTSSGTSAREGSFMYYRSGYYYLFWSEGQCCGYDSSKPASGGEYKIKVCRSTSPNSGFVGE